MIRYDKKRVIEFVNKNSYFKLFSEKGDNLTFKSNKFCKDAYLGASETDIDNCIRLQNQLKQNFENIHFYLTTEGEYVVLETSDRKI